MNIETISLYAHYGYSQLEGAAGVLTCYSPSIPERLRPGHRRPAVLIMPGGGYGNVTDRESEPVALRFMNRGYAAFVLNYSIAPVRFPTALREAAMAMRFIRENCERFEVNADMIAAIGFSAGGHLCGCLGTMYDCPEVADIAQASVIRPDVLGLCYPVLVSWGKHHEGSFRNLTGGDSALTQRLSLDKQVRADMPPAFIWHTRDDGGVPSRNSLIFAQAMDDQGVDYALHIHHHGVHGLSTADEITYHTEKVPQISADIFGWEDRMIDFFRECGLKITDQG